MRFNPLNMKLIRSIRQMVKTPFVTFGFGLGTSWQERLIQQSILKNRIRGLGKNHKKRPSSLNWSLPLKKA